MDKEYVIDVVDRFYPDDNVSVVEKLHRLIRERKVPDKNILAFQQQARIWAENRWTCAADAPYDRATL